MSSRRIRLFVSFVLILSAVPLLTGAGNGDEARAEHQRIVEFWTPERVAQAVPRDFVLDPGTGRFSPSKKPDGKPGGGPGGGGGGGGGGEDTSVVTGSSWKEGGEIDGAVGKVLFAMGGSYYVCSATVIKDPGGNDRSLILTAAHCVYDESDPDTAFADNWMFIPDYDAKPASLTADGTFCGGTLYGCWTASVMVVHDGFADAGGFNDAAVVHDFAVVAVGLGGHDPKTLLEDVSGVTPQAVDFGTNASSPSVTGWAFGYPAQKKWKGNDLIYCRGPIDTDPFNNGETYRLNECKLNGGSSGGGWLIDFNETTGSRTVISLNSYGYNGINAMHGPMLNGDTQAVYALALSLGEGSNGIVP